jgi:hypothetical protein
LTIILGRLVSVAVTQYYVIFSIVSVINMLTSISIFQAPLIIAMEVSKGYVFMALLHLPGRVAQLEINQLEKELRQELRPQLRQ